MFLLRRPSRQTIEDFIRVSQGLPLSYGPIGIVASGAPGYDLDEAVIAIGRGKEDLARARASLRAWKHFDLGWVELFPPDAPIEAGTIVAVLVRHFGFWSLNGCRVVRVDGDRDRDVRFRFAYGTLANHAAAGEELFEVFHEPWTDEVMYRIRAVSRPRLALTRLGYPIVRRLQARFRSDSAKAMKQATGSR